MSTEDRDDKDAFQSLIAEILEAEKSGQDLDRNALIQEHPELADSLREFFAIHDQMRVAAKRDEPTLRPTGSGLDDRHCLQIAVLRMRQEGYLCVERDASPWCVPGRKATPTIDLPGRAGRGGR